MKQSERRVRDGDEQASRLPKPVDLFGGQGIECLGQAREPALASRFHELAALAGDGDFDGAAVQRLARHKSQLLQPGHKLRHRRRLDLFRRRQRAKRLRSAVSQDRQHGQLRAGDAGRHIFLSHIAQKADRGAVQHVRDLFVAHGRAGHLTRLSIVR
jgi:hypothetical protein